MFPVRDDNPQLRVPVVTYLLIGLNVAAWIFLQGLGVEPALSRSVCLLGLIPGELLGSVDPTQVPGPLPCPVGRESSWHTVVSSMFMHGSWLHLIGNMWFLWIFGGNVEDAMGRVRFAVFYLLSGLAAAAAQVATNPESPIPMVGASGAIGGVMGAYIVLYPRVHVHLLVLLGFYVTTVAVPAIAMLGYWAVLQLIGGLANVGSIGGGTAFWAHVGGFAAGAVLVFLFRDPELLARHPYHGWKQRRHATRAWHRVNGGRGRWR
ncbi:MAG TPA: rhomboid family intramembrane serine protease [Woeseiaceae bacterium]|nr:rhomboid family intramembrane serine protease [Woeseiaceae bacterium]